MLDTHTGQKIINYYDETNPQFPPSGFRLLREDEIVKPDDLCCCPYGSTKMAWFRVHGGDNSGPCFGKTVKECQAMHPHVTGWATPGYPIFEGRILTQKVITDLVEQGKMQELEEFLDWLDNQAVYETLWQGIDFTTIENRGRIECIHLPPDWKLRSNN